MDKIMRRHVSALTSVPAVVASLISLVAFVSPASWGEEIVTTGRWVHYERQAPVASIRGIYSLPGGKICAETEVSLHIFDGNSWVKFPRDTIEFGLNPPFINDSSGNLYFVDSSGDLVVGNNGLVTGRFPADMVYPLVGAFSPAGELYMASYHNTKGGIYRFDRTSVTQVKNCRSRSIAFDQAGTLWTACIEPGESSMKLLSYDGIAWHDHTGNIESVSNDLTVQAAPDGAVWVNNLGRYTIYRNGEWSSHNGGRSPMYLCFDDAGGVWGYNNPSVYRLSGDGQWTVSFTMNTGTLNMPFSLAVTGDLRIWTFNANTVYSYSLNGNAIWTALDIPYDLGSNIVTCLEYTPDGRLICGHGLRDVMFHDSEQKGVSILEDYGWYNYNRADSLRFLNVYEIENLSGNELAVYTDSGFKLYDGSFWSRPDSLFVSDETSMDYDDNSILWIGTIEHGLHEYNFMSYYPVWYPSMDVSDHIYVSNIYVNTFNKIVYMHDHFFSIISFDTNTKTWEKVMSKDFDVSDFVVDDDGFIWAARKDNLVRWTGERWDNIISEDTQEEIALRKARFIERDDDGRLWASGFDNTGFYENGIWHRFPELTGTASDAFARYIDGRMAFNAFNEDRTVFYGVYEFYPGSPVGFAYEKPENIDLMVSAFPNPFNAATSISFTISRPERVEITVYSITGQRVKTIASRHFTAGNGRVVWNTENERGEPAGSGIYFYRVRAGNAVKSGKMLLLR